MNDNNENKKNNEELVIVYRPDTLSSLYLQRLFQTEGNFIRKSVIDRNIVISSLNTEYNILYSMDTNIDKIIKLLSQHTGLWEQKQPIQDKEKNTPFKMTFNV